MNLFDTIAAVSTPYGKGGVALIRISGGAAAEIADKVFSLKNGKKLSNTAERRMVYGDIISPETGETVDDVMAVYMKAPSTYTGEDTVEITCHGGILITHAVLSAVLLAGARAAEPGEYTRRALVNGRISLTEAESLGLMLEAKNQTQLRLYRSGMNGRLSESIREAYGALCNVQSSIFACIDYPDEDLAEMSRDEMLESLDVIKAKIKRLIDTFRTGSAISEGIPSVICGRTNAGKSSLYNLMAGYDAAIVTDIEGTTRDVLRQNVSLGKVNLRISDTAGLRESDDAVENIGIDRAIEEIEDSELIFAVFDGSKPLCTDDLSLIERIGAIKDGRCAIAVINKSDLSQAIFDSDESRALLDGVFSVTLPLCAKTGEGFDGLIRAVEDLYIDGSLDVSNDAIVINARQLAALSGAYDALSNAATGLSCGAELDMCCSDVEEAMISLGELDGRSVSEDVVSAIFSRFCVGK